MAEELSQPQLRELQAEERERLDEEWIAIAEKRRLLDEDKKRVIEERRQLEERRRHFEEGRRLFEEERRTIEDERRTMEDENMSMREDMQKMIEERENIDRESLKHSLETDIQSLRNQLSTANDASESLVKSKQELEIRYGRATEISQLMSRILQWHISTFDNVSMEGLESEDVFCEMGAIVDTMERYAESTTEAVSMPEYMPGMTLVGKATEMPEPNLAAARHLWISSRCGSLVLDVAQAFFMQQEISSAQFALLPWIHASLNCAITTMCERSTLTPDLASYLLCILRGLVYTATVAREWSENHAWIPNAVEMLAKIKDWLVQHVANEASFLMMVADQVNEIVIAHELPSTAISPNLFPEAQRIDSTNSDIPNGMAMVIDNSGMIILFTADDAFVFGASEVKVVEFDNRGMVVFIFEPQLSGLPENLREIRLHDCGSAEAVNPHQRLLKTVLPKERLALVSSRKYFR